MADANDTDIQAAAPRRLITIFGGTGFLGRGVVNAVSLYVERSRDTFRDVHIDAAVRVARVARDAGVEHLAHISGIGADAGSSFEARSERDTSTRHITR